MTRARDHGPLGARQLHAQALGGLNPARHVELAAEHQGRRVR